jgi:hypothetical protein
MQTLIDVYAACTMEHDERTFILLYFPTNVDQIWPSPERSRSMSLLFVLLNVLLHVPITP